MAKSIVNKYGAKADAYGPEWLEFADDPRYSGHRPTFKTAAIDALNWLNSRYPKELGSEIYSGGGKRLFVTWNATGIRAMNRLIDRKIFVCGLVKGGAKVEGKPATDRYFTEHDIIHYLFIDSIMFANEFSRSYYESFRLDDIQSSLSAQDQIIFDFGYFLFIHEGLMSRDWAEKMEARINQITIKTLQEIYQDSMGRDFDFNFGATDLITSNLKGPQREHLINRLRNEFFDDLPLEMQQAVKNESNENASTTIGHFLDEITTLFLKTHFDKSKHFFRLKK